LGQVAIYCRVSTDDQSCERQERDLRAFAKRAGHASYRMRLHGEVRDQSQHCGVSAAGTDPNGCSPPEGISRWQFCTEAYKRVRRVKRS